MPNGGPNRTHKGNVASNMDIFLS